jgi:hypothetical protein
MDKDYPSPQVPAKKKGQNRNSAPIKIQYPMKNHSINVDGHLIIVL